MELKFAARRLATALAMALTAATLSACAAGARPESMALTAASGAQVAPTDPGYKAYRVAHVDGGGKTNPMWISSVSAEDFQKALESSLRALGLLSDDPATAKTEITANLQKIQRPMVGLDMSVTTTVHYSAKSTSDQKVQFDDVVAATGTATVGEAFLAVERLQKANEASMKENIKTFIDRLRNSTPPVQAASN